MKFLLAGVGGFIGAAGRYALNLTMLRLSAVLTFPIATLIVNLSGSFAIGLLLGSTVNRAWLSDELRVFLIVGILGGFTTFSSFSAETLQLWRDIGAARALANIALTLGLCLLGVWLGDTAGRMIAR